jgi:hypothetical protein
MAAVTNRSTSKRSTAMARLRFAYIKARSTVPKPLRGRSLLIRLNKLSASKLFNDIAELGTGTKLQQCTNLLSMLVIQSNLDLKTAEYLKDRAASLNG